MTKPVHEAESSPSLGSDPPVEGGEWGLDLWSGAAWFSDWFYERLNWPRQIKRERLDDLRPHFSAEAWNALLQAIRGHLELQLPFDVQVRVQICDGQTQWWRVQGSAERNVGGQPVSLVGGVRDVSAEV